ncbi:MAG: hypothetical protein GY861_04655 [bacterium]|nr:hypothetical protein [bacterium]
MSIVNMKSVEFYLQCFERKKWTDQTIRNKISSLKKEKNWEEFMALRVAHEIKVTNNIISATDEGWYVYE